MLVRTPSSPRLNATQPQALDGSTYTVKAGDSLAGLAKANGLTLDEMQRANPGLRDPSRLRVGQSITIPHVPEARPEALAERAEAAAVRTPASDATVQGTRERASATDPAMRGRINNAEAAVAPGQVAAEPLSFTATLRRGASGPTVRELQTQLNARGAQVNVDGTFGRNTENAVKDFQRRNGLTADGVVGPDTRAAFERTASTAPTAPVTTPDQPAAPATLRVGAKGPEVEALQTRLNTMVNAGLQVDGDFGRGTQRAVETFQRRAGIPVDGAVGPATRQAMDEVAAGTRQLAPADQAPAPTPGSAINPGPRSNPVSRTITAEGNTFQVHDMSRAQFGTRSTPGNRIISMDSNSVSGRTGEILRPLVIIPNNATPAERAAAQAAVDRVAQWLNQNAPGDRPATGIVKTTAENGRGLGGFFHTEFHSVNDNAAVELIRQRPEEYARILADTLGAIPGANFISPHGVNGDPGAVANTGSTEVGIAQYVIRNGFSRL